VRWAGMAGKPQRRNPSPMASLVFGGGGGGRGGGAWGGGGGFDQDDEYRQLLADVVSKCLEQLIVHDYQRRQLITICTIMRIELGIWLRINRD